MKNMQMLTNKQQQEKLTTHMQNQYHHMQYSK